MEKTLALSIVIGGVLAGTLRNAVGSTVSQLDRMGTALDGARKESLGAAKAVDAAERAIGRVDGFKRLGKEVLEAGRAHRDAEAKVRALAREIEASEKPTKAQEKALAQARREVVRTARAAEAKQARFRSLRDELRAAGIDTRNLAEAERKLAEDLDQAKRKAGDAAAAVGKLENSMEAAERRAKASAAIRTTFFQIGALGAALAPAARAAGNFEEQLVSFGLVAGVSGAKLEDLRGRLKGLSREVNQSAQDLLGGVGVLVGKGMGYDQAVASIGAIGKAATATGASMDEMSNLAFSVMDNLKVMPQDLERVLDIMAKAGDLGGFELKDMASYFPQLTASAKALGLEGAEGVGTLAAALQVAMKGASDAGTAANNFANFLNKATAPETVRNFNKFGIDIKEAMADALMAGENPMEALVGQIGLAIGVDFEAEMAKGIAGGKSAEAAAEGLAQKFKLGELFGDAQVLNFLTPLIANMEDYKRVRDEAMNSDGAVNDKFKAMMDTFNAATGGLGNAWGNLVEAFGKSLLPILTPLVNGLAKLLDGIGWLVDTMPEVTGLLTGAGFAFLGFRLAAAGASWAMTFFQGGLPGVIARLIGLRGATTAASTAQGRLGVMAMLTSARMGAAGLLGRLGALGSGLLGFARTAIPVVIGAFRTLTVAMMTNPIGLIIGGLAMLAGLVIANWDSVKGFFLTLWEPIKPVWEAFLGWVLGLWDKISAPFQAVAEFLGFGGGEDGGDGPSADAARARPAAMLAGGEDRAERTVIRSTGAGAPGPAGGSGQMAGAGAGPLTINAPITIHAAPGMDEREVAALVKREFEAMMRRAAADRRGALHDG